MPYRMDLFLAWIRQILGQGGPAWTPYFPSRNVNSPSYGAVLNDIESHLPASHQWWSSDRVTHAHEATHGINSLIRVPFNLRGWKHNAFYCLRDRAVVVGEISGIRVRDVAAAVPRPLRGAGYNWYLTGSAGRSWDDRPSYLLDEWVAYTNGSEVRKELGLTGRLGTVELMTAFMLYSFVLPQAAGSRDRQLREFIRWNAERTLRLQQGESEGAALLEAFRNHNDADNLRAFVRSYLGDGWCERVLEI